MSGALLAVGVSVSADATSLAGDVAPAPSPRQLVTPPPMVTLPATRPAPLGAAATQASAPYDTSLYGYLAWAGSGVAGFPAAARQGMWEISYMFGFNRTPPARGPMPDPLAANQLATAENATKPAVIAALPISPGLSPPAAPAPRVTAPVSAGAPPVAAQAVVADKQEDADPALLANFIYDRGNRRPDGSYFVPKTLQRLFNVRVAKAETAELAPALKLTGRIVPDPRAHGAVQAGVMGRFEPPEGGQPVLGASVTKGQLLGYIVPAIGVVDRTQVRRDVARLTTEIRVETENLEILKQFRFVPFRDGKIYQSEERLLGLRKEREALLPLLQTQEALVAPVDGVVSSAQAIAGKILQAGDTVFDIVSPDLIWVEALAPDPTIAAAAGQAVSATAMTPEGQLLTLSYVGSGLAMQMQSTPVMFRIDAPPPGLRLGRPVSVTLRGEAAAQRGIAVARESVTLGTDGLQEVWEQTAPEVFLPHPVRTRDIDGATVLVLEGLPSGARVVTRGARLMAQLQ